MGAPRLRRAVRMGEDERGSEPGDASDFPPAPVGQVRVRLASDETVADLRGPSACEVLDPSEAATAVARLGPDPASRRGDGGPRRHGRTPDVAERRGGPAADGPVGRRGDRQHLPRRAALPRPPRPAHPGRRVPREVAGALWDDWAVLLAEGIRTGIIVTRDVPAVATRSPTRRLRNWVYHRTGLPCLVSGTPVVVEEMAEPQPLLVPRLPGLRRPSAVVEAQQPAPGAVVLDGDALVPGQLAERVANQGGLGLERRRVRLVDERVLRAARDLGRVGLDADREREAGGGGGDDGGAGQRDDAVRALGVVG